MSSMKSCCWKRGACVSGGCVKLLMYEPITGAAIVPVNHNLDCTPGYRPSTDHRRREGARGCDRARGPEPTACSSLHGQPPTQKNTTINMIYSCYINPNGRGKAKITPARTVIPASMSSHRVSTSLETGPMVHITLVLVGELSLASCKGWGCAGVGKRSVCSRPSRPETP